MKLQTTKKQVLQHFNTVLSIGYCDAQYLLDCKTPFAYSADDSGWSCDYYQIGAVCISTGNSSIGTPVNYSLLRELEGNAELIKNDYKLSYSDREQQLDDLIKQLIESVLHTKKNE